MMAAKFGVAILAAGTSSRLGEPKQLLPWGRSTLLEHAVETALKSEVGPVAVVLGHEAARIEEKISHLNVQVIENSEYELGQGTSVHAAVQWASFADLSGVLLMVCDQPGLTPDDLKKLTETAQVKGIAAALYGSTSGAEEETGVPVFFTSEFFPDLLEISEEQGAKSILRKNRDRVTAVDLGNRVQDIDTRADYENASKNAPPN